jgi:hypothetical protein
MLAFYVDGEPQMWAALNIESSWYVTALVNLHQKTEPDTADHAFVCMAMMRRHYYG